MEKANEEYINGSTEDHQEDILSLCDLPIHNISDNTDNHDHQDSNPNEFNPNSSFSVDNQDNFFEFFSEEWNIPTTAAAAAAAATATTTTVRKSSPFQPNDENIIFCEKEIPSQQVLSNANEPTTLNHKTKKIPLERQEKRGGLIPWKSNSIFSKSIRDSKLLLVLLGLPPKIPTDETQLKSDIRNRQIRRSPSTFLPSDGGGGDQEVVAVSRRRASENVLWRLIKAASCFGGQPRENAVV